MTQFVALLVLLVCCTTGGEIAVTYATKRIGEVESLRPAALLRFAWRVARGGWIWLAIPLLATAFYTQLILLSWKPISLVIPAASLSYVIGALGAKLILKEDVTPKRWAGVALVFFGVVTLLTS